MQMLTGSGYKFEILPENRLAWEIYHQAKALSTPQKIDTECGTLLLPSIEKLEFVLNAFPELVELDPLEFDFLLKKIVYCRDTETKFIVQEAKRQWQKNIPST